MRIKQILAGKTKQISRNALLKQKYAAAMSWQILNLYPAKNSSKNWEYYKNLKGVLLADEVGGGKTFESLSIITKSYIECLNKNRRNFRVLIIANPAIRSKWEWRENDSSCDLKKFIDQSAIGDKNIISKITSLFRNEVLIKSKNSWKELNKNLESRCIILASVNALPPTQGQKVNAEFKKKYKFPYNKFDWIIADEAHIVKSGYLQTNEDISSVSKSAIRKLYATLNSCTKAKILLLTATPFHNNVKELKQMISILDHKNDNGVIEIAKCGLEALDKEFGELKYLIDNNDEFVKKLKKIYMATNHNINLLWEEESNYNRPAEIRKGGQRDGLDDFLRDIMVRNRKEKLNETVQFAKLNEKEILNYLLLRDLIMTKDDEAKKMVSIQLCQLVSNPQSFKDSLSQNTKGKNETKRLKILSEVKKYFGDDLIYQRKYNTLLQTIESLSLNDKKVITIFCRFIPAIKRLEKDLQKDKYTVRILHGGIKVEKRMDILNNLKELNKKSNRKIIFIVSQVGNEGLDFDEFSNTIIHFDSHYNPAVISQRNGRIYRRSNKSRDIKVYHIILSETYDQRIKFIEEEKRRMKDFYLGDSNLEELYAKIFNQDQTKKKGIFDKLKDFRIDLEPKRKYLYPQMKKEI